jgi:hypothetical protein
MGMMDIKSTLITWLAISPFRLMSTTPPSQLGPSRILSARSRHECCSEANDSQPSAGRSPGVSVVSVVILIVSFVVVIAHHRVVLVSRGGHC